MFSCKYCGVENMEIEEYLRDHHLDDITDMMNEPDAYAHAAINIRLVA